MNSERRRRCAAEIAIGLLVCGAVQMFVISPAQQRLSAIRAQCDAAAGPGGVDMTLSAAQLADLTGAASRQAAEVRDLSSVAEVETDLFGALMAMADRTGVRIDQLEPSAPVTAASDTPQAAPPAEGAPPPEPPPNDGAVAYSMSITATYGRLQRFLTELRRGAGFVVVRSVRIEPGDEDGQALAARTATEGAVVRAHVVSEHHWFDVSRLERSLAPATSSAISTGAGSMNR